MKRGVILLLCLALLTPLRAESEAERGARQARESTGSTVYVTPKAPAKVDLPGWLMAPVMVLGFVAGIAATVLVASAQMRPGTRGSTRTP